MAKFHAFAESDDVSRSRLLRFVCSLWASELSSGFQLTVLRAELLTLSPLSLSPSLSCSLSLSVFRSQPPSPSLPPLLNSSSSVWQHLCGCQREGDGFDLNINAFMYSMCMLCEAKGEGKMKGNDLRPVFPTRVQSQLHPMHYPYWADKKKGCGWGGGHTTPKGNSFSCRVVSSLTHTRKRTRPWFSTRMANMRFFFWN